MLSVTGVMILPPYLACTAYLWKICTNREYSEKLPVSRSFAWFCGVAGSVYAVWMIYAAGIKYLLMAFIFFLIGIPVYIWARHDAEKASSVAAGNQEGSGVNMPIKGKGEYFTGYELLGTGVITVVALFAIIAFSTGYIKF